MIEKAHSIKSYLQWYLGAKSLFQLHSPYLYEILSATMDRKMRFYAMDRIAYQRILLLKDGSAITRVDYGAGTKTGQDQSTVARIARASASPALQCEQLFRLVQALKPKRILELGTSVGLSTAYLASAAPSAEVVGLEGDPQLAHIAQRTVTQSGAKNARILVGKFEDTLEKALEECGEIDVVFLDGNHKYAPTMEYFNIIKPYLSKKACVVVDDIYWSIEMTKAWNEIKKDGDIKASVDLYYYGLLFFNPSMSDVQHHALISSKYKPWLGLGSI